MVFHILNEDAIHNKKQTIHLGFQRKFWEKLITSLKFKQVVFCAEIVVTTWQPGFWNWKGKWPNLKRSLATKLFHQCFHFYQGKEREGEEVRNVKLSYLLKTSFMTQSCVMTSRDGDWGEEKKVRVIYCDFHFHSFLFDDNKVGENDFSPSSAKSLKMSGHTNYPNPREINFISETNMKQTFLVSTTWSVFKCFCSLFRSYEMKKACYARNKIPLHLWSISTTCLHIASTRWNALALNSSFTIKIKPNFTSM